MDLNSLLQPMETEVEILHPVTNKPTGIKVVLLSRYHPDIKAMVRKIQDTRMAQARRNKPMDAATIEDETLEVLAASVKSWQGLDRDGEALACTRENVLDLLRNPGYQWMRRQIDESLGNDALFFGA